MERQLELWPRDFGKDLSNKIRLAITPRVLLLFKQEALLVPYKDTGWNGLPGGHITTNEFTPELNLVDPRDAFPTLQRETFEETGVDIFGIEQTTIFLGFYEIYGIDSVNEIATQYFSPIFVSRMTPNMYTQAKSNDKNLLLDLRNPGVVPLFPDARLSVDLLKRKYQEPGGWLGDEPLMYFQTKPVPQLLTGPPKWFSDMLQSGETVELDSSPSEVLYRKET